MTCPSGFDIVTWSKPLSITTCTLIQLIIYIGIKQNKHQVCLIKFSCTVEIYISKEKIIIAKNKYIILMSHMFCHPHIYPNIKKKTQIKGKKIVINANNKSLHKVDVHDDPEFAIAH